MTTKKLMLFGVIAISALSLSPFVFKKTHKIDNAKFVEIIPVNVTRLEVPLPSLKKDRSHHDRDKTLTASKTKITPKTDAPSTERQKIVNAWDASNQYPEPSDDNYDQRTHSPYMEEVELANRDNRCKENCAESLYDLLPADGPLADQINDDALKKQAVIEGIVDIEAETRIVLNEQSDKPGAPTENGAFVVPE